MPAGDHVVQIGDVEQVSFGGFVVLGVNPLFWQLVECVLWISFGFDLAATADIF